MSRVKHVALVVDDIDEALEFWRDGLGLKVANVEEVPEQAAVVAFLETGDQELELVKPTDEDSGSAKFLRERGPGMHHICFEVTDLATCLEHLKSMDIALINEEPVAGAGGKQIAFIHPKSTHGVLVELSEQASE
ncbi:MAG: methylmalonyl-CoA epimerase [Anaerolineales bacterium]